jgi:hypothetical protein
MDEDGYEFFPKDVADTLPPLYSQDGKGDEAVVYVKFFQPWGSWTWFATEYDPEDRLFFGMVHGFEKELGFFSLAEIQEIRGPGGLKIERDIWWTPRTLREL